MNGEVLNNTNIMDVVNTVSPLSEIVAMYLTDSNKKDDNKCHRLVYLGRSGLSCSFALNILSTTTAPRVKRHRSHLQRKPYNFR